MVPMAPYEDVIAEADIQLPMPDEPPVPPPRAAVTSFSYVRGHKPPGTYTSGYKPFAGAGSSSGGGGGGGGQPPQPPQLSRHTSAMDATALSSTSEGTHSSCTLATCRRERRSLRQVQTKDPERSRRFSWRF